ncbi:MAG: hypothetical protein ACRDGM_08475 [bacterium]
MRSVTEMGTVQPSAGFQTHDLGIPGQILPALQSLLTRRLEG